MAIRSLHVAAREIGAMVLTSVSLETFMVVKISKPNIFRPETCMNKTNELGSLKSKQTDLKFAFVCTYSVLLTTVAALT